MNVITAVQKYIIKMTEDTGPQMKVLLLDKETTSIVSMVYSQSEMLQKEVYLFERLDMVVDNEAMKHLKCIVFLRPTRENVTLLSKELRNPRYGIYYIYVSNIISKADIKLLAENDEQELVRELVEFYADYLAVSPHLFSLNIPICSQGDGWDPVQLQRAMQGVGAVLLSLKKYPIIRYRSSSKMARRLAEKIGDLLNKEDVLFDFRNGNHQPVLLILDRREDAITPLLTQWTYQAMVHEILTINNNRVDLRHVEGISKELQEVLLSSLQDEFYAQNMFRNYGEIGQTIKGLMTEYQQKFKSHKKVESIADMKAFVETYPQFKKMSGTVAKHLTIVGELSNVVGQRRLLDISEIEQQIACQDQHTQQLQKIKRILSSDNIREEEASKLVMLYALRYGTHPNNHITGLINILSKNCVSQHRIELIHKLMTYSKKDSHLSDTFGTQEAVIQITKQLFKDLQGVENIYTQHTPVLKQTLEDLIKGKLKESAFPFCGYNTPPFRVSEVIVFMVGGVTYEESLAVHQLNCIYPDIKIVLGGTMIHNSSSFLKEVESAVTNTNTTSSTEKSYPSHYSKNY